ncbi:MarR family transcriptional regulator [Clostridium gasigenes]|uniref:HTH marR-type domain-containing protein n=1 Tax=Clostridium gasigenes TaxID=94869 RepID=A0A1H0M5X7_9CLOT|nr:helix-turn-helix domain-containing protein [Clostridium gasigenes]SDO75859.1 hypothetical protein SAMN04488529_101335 [Clostridium gasigenes]
MKEEYIKHLTTIDISGLCFRVLMLLVIGNYTQSAIANLLNKDRQVINKKINELEKSGLIELVKIQGTNKFYRAIVDIKRLKVNIPGQIKMM